MPDENYNSAYTGPQIDSAVGNVLQNSGNWTAKNGTVTLTTGGWGASGSRYSQTVSVPIVAADTPVIVVDVALSGTDIDADNEMLNAWAGPAACNVGQGNGTLTFYSAEVPAVNISVNVGVA